jgi:hypothetical protein
MPEWEAGSAWVKVWGNGLPFSRAALIDRNVTVPDSGVQNGPDLVDA